MNSIASINLDWDKINDELLKNKLTVIVTNGFFVSRKLVDSQNIIFFINDPILDLFLSDTDSYFQKKSHLWSYIESLNLTKDDLEALSFDFDSCLWFLSSKNVKLAVNQNAKCINKFDRRRLHIIKTNLIEKLLHKFTFKWHWDGQKPVTFFNRYGLKTFPVESRLTEYIFRSNYLSKIWYLLNLSQTPNTFYRALDFSIKKDFTQILFIGKNTQLDDSLFDKNNISQYPSVKYKYFFSNQLRIWKIKSYQSLLREQYYSSQYISMLKKIYRNKNFISIENISCFKDYFSEKLSTLYTTNNNEINSKIYE